SDGFQIIVFNDVAHGIVCLASRNQWNDSRNTEYDHRHPELLRQQMRHNRHSKGTGKRSLDRIIKNQEKAAVNEPTAHAYEPTTDQGPAWGIEDDAECACRQKTK